MKVRLIILSCIIFLFSCSKDEFNQEDFHIGFYKPTKYEIQKARLFSKHGEVKDTYKIADYAKRNKIRFILSNVLTPIEEQEPSQIELFDNKTAIITHYNQKHYRDILKKDSYIYLESRAFGSYPEEIRNQEPSIFDFLKHKPLSESEPVSRPTGNVIFNKHCFYVKADKKIIRMPILEYDYRGFETIDINEGSKSKYGFGKFNINNEFNLDVLNYLTDNDTVIIRESNIIYERQ